MKAIFDRQNLWRQSGFLFSKEPFIHREIHQAIIRHLGRKEISVLVGSRQIGKTFTIQKLIEHLTRNYVAVKDLHGIPIYFRPVWDIFEFA